MTLLDTIIADLADSRTWKYGDQSPAAAEPAALTALALIGAGRQQAALPALDWLAARQADDGSVGVSDEQPEPKWPTSLAVLAWHAFDPAGSLFRIGSSRVAVGCCPWKVIDSRVRIEWATIQRCSAGPGSRVHMRGSSLPPWHCSPSG